MPMHRVTRGCGMIAYHIAMANGDFVQDSCLEITIAKAQARKLQVVFAGYICAGCGEPHEDMSPEEFDLVMEAFPYYVSTGEDDD